jgi:hypothetical protein
MWETSLMIFFSTISEVNKLKIWVAVDLAISLAIISLIFLLIDFCWELWA